MTGTEKILNLLEMNANTPSLVVDEINNIIACNREWSEKFGSPEIGKGIFKLFDKSSGTLIKNALIDAKTFDKIQRKQITFETEESIIERNLIISPFRLSQKLYFYVLIYSDLPARGEVFVYPSSDDHNLRERFSNLFGKLSNELPQTLIERKNFQQLIDREIVPIAVSQKHRIIISNSAFRDSVNIENSEISNIRYKEIFEANLCDKIISAENESVLNKSIFILEKIDEKSSQSTSKLFLLLPLINNGNEVFSFILFVGKNNIANNMEGKDRNLPEKQLSDLKEQNNEGDLPSVDPQIIYDKNDFRILSVNDHAVELYGYSVDEFIDMNMTQLFPPEEMQKLLTLPDKDEKESIKQTFKDGSINDLTIKVSNVNWKNIDSYQATITVEHQFEEEVIKLEELEEKKEGLDKKIVKAPVNDEDVSDFLSNLFHEILTPVNVILGFVQEIVDSLDDLTEEQSESAQIIKDNQQILLQTMNTAVQYAQLAEDKINISVDSFDFNNSLVDLQDSIAQISSQKNLNLVFDEISEPLNLIHDRSKLIFAISYFIKFVVKMITSSNIYISAKVIGNEFVLFVKDDEKGISDNLAANILKIYDPHANNKNDFGISLVAIKLACKLNELLHVNIREYVDSNDVKTIAFVTFADFNSLEKSGSYEHEKGESQIPEDVEITDSMMNTDEEIIEPEPVAEVSSESESTIKNGEIDEKIIEDIEEEKEIVTEEIASIEKVDEPAFDLSRSSCLFIDDNLDTQMLFKSQMNDFKLLKVSSNLNEALPLLNKYNFDFIFVDFNLNDVYNGLDALKIIRQFQNYTNTPIIAVTAFPFEGDRQKFIDFGFTDYMIKPLLRDKILNALHLISS